MSNPGEKNKKVQLQKRTMVDGEEKYYIEDIKTVWAKVEQISSREAVLAGAICMPDTLRVTIWYRPFGAEEYRLAYGDDIYNIVGAIDVKGLHVDLELTCDKELDAEPAIPKPE